MNKIKYKSNYMSQQNVSFKHMHHFQVELFHILHNYNLCILYIQFKQEGEICHCSSWKENTVNNVKWVTNLLKCSLWRENEIGNQREEQRRKERVQRHFV